jgi:hypothetical protein
MDLPLDIRPGSWLDPPMSEALERLRPCFAEPCVERGRSYFAERRVRLEQLSEHDLFGTVEGTHNYRVAIRREGLVLRAWCECPFVIDRWEPCKHLWAALLTADSAEMLELMLAGRCEFELDSELEGEEEFDGDVDHEDDIDEDEDDDDEIDDADTWRRLASLPQLGHRRTPSWREIVRATPPAIPVSLELCAFIDLRELPNGFGICLGTRRLTAAAPANLEPITGRLADLARFRDPFDRWLLELAAALPSPMPATFCLRLGRYGALEILPELCASGRIFAMASAPAGACRRAGSSRRARSTTSRCSPCPRLPGTRASRGR